MHPIDDVATALTELTKGTEIEFTPDGPSLVLQDDIPFGHKFALRDVQQGQHVHKYGQVIGAATARIEPGQHVHVHNVDSLRGRGDLTGKEDRQ
ncbi:UxaA family hydrolase [Alicyclobacillus curvatus]|jgi:altronate dehydratase small subunit|nr:UxaA family hydrolase [Alicyclobacillus curvatus]